MNVQIEICLMLLPLLHLPATRLGNKGLNGQYRGHHFHPMVQPSQEGQYCQWGRPLTIRQ